MQAVVVLLLYVLCSAAAAFAAAVVNWLFNYVVDGYSTPIRWHNAIVNGSLAVAVGFVFLLLLM